MCRALHPTWAEAGAGALAKRFAADNCGFKRVAMTASTISKASPIPSRPEPRLFEFESQGGEVHEMAFGRIKGDA